MVDKIVDGVPTKVPETHDYTTYTISYAGDNYLQTQSGSWMKPSVPLPATTPKT